MTLTAALSYRRREARLLLLSATIVVVAMFALYAAQEQAIDSSLLILIGGFAGMFFAAHLVICKVASYADQLILPVASLLNGIGLVLIHRIDMETGRSLAKSQLMWTAIGLTLFILVLVFLRDHRSLQDYSYLLGVGGLILTALPIAWPANISADAKVWISIGPFSIQPGEFGKIMLLLFFAALLVNKRALFTLAGKQILGLQFPRLRDMGPLFFVWGIALLIMGFQSDFGPALLLFGTVLGMLYIATSRVSWVLIGLFLAAVGALSVYQVSAKIQERVINFVDPIGHIDDKGFQLSQSLFGLSFGGVTGTGLGEGYPGSIPVAWSDFILAVIGEELGLIGLAAILMLYLIIISRGFRAAMMVNDSYGKLVAAGLSLTVAVQIFVVTGGISRLLPMTGLTTPFLAHGGSSILANYILIAIVLRISHDARSPHTPTDTSAEQNPEHASAHGEGHAPAQVEGNIAGGATHNAAGSAAAPAHRQQQQQGGTW